MNVEQPPAKDDEGKKVSAATEDADATERSSGQADGGGRSDTALHDANEAERGSG